MNIDPLRKIRSRELRSLRKQSKLTQAQLSLLSGLKACTISRIERGKVAWSIDSDILFREGIRKFMETRKPA